ncbi:MAG: undecaprenyl-diphosphate phosphatase [bacterium]
MHWFQAIILGMIEGITEFLPISSTGHMILAGKLMGIASSEFTKSFEVIIQLGAILAVVVIYIKRVWEMKVWWGRVVIAFVPTGVLGILLYKIVKTYFLGNDMLVTVSLIVGGVALIAIEKYLSKSKNIGKEIEVMEYPKLAIVGLAQSLSMIPGVSRSAATIFGGMGVGMSRRAAVEFSFLLAVPTMMAATGLDLVKMGTSFAKSEIQLLAIGFVVAFLTAWIVVKAFIKYVQHHSFEIFGWYRIAIGILYLLIVK